jgi:hypothetical protein
MVRVTSPVGVVEQGKYRSGLNRNLGELTSSGIMNNAATRASGIQITPD